MLVQTACNALRSGHVLKLEYDDASRLVEVHAVGFTADDAPVAHVWQLDGDVPGWQMLPLNAATGAEITHEKSLAPRPGYEAGDKAMSVISCQL
jgi:hypothetical protein